VIFDFIKLMAVYSKLEHEMVATEELLRHYLFGPKRYSEVIFLEENGVKVGFALFFHSFSTFLARPGIYLEDLFVKAEHRGKGYGKKLFAYLAAETIRRNGGRLEWTVLAWNKPSIDFYNSLGAMTKADWLGQRLTGEALKKLADQA
jgi:GNAT superfamily N-acetyltransferase